MSAWDKEHPHYSEAAREAVRVFVKAVGQTVLVRFASGTVAQDDRVQPLPFLIQLELLAADLEDDKLFVQGNTPQ